MPVAHQTGRAGQPEHGRTVDDDLSVSVPERKVEARRARSVENQPEPVRIVNCADCDIRLSDESNKSGFARLRHKSGNFPAANTSPRWFCCERTRIGFTEVYEIVDIRTDIKSIARRVLNVSVTYLGRFYHNFAYEIVKSEKNL